MSGGRERLLRAALVVHAAALTLLMGCETAGRSTGILLVVEADPEARARIVRLQVDVESRAASGGWQPADDVALQVPDPLLWPRRGAIEPLRGDASRTYRVTLRGEEEDGSPLVVARVASGFVPGQWRQLTVLLTSACFGVECPEGESCSEGACVPAYKDPESLPPALPDAEASCERDDECDDRDPCTVDWCLRGTCVSARPEDGALPFREVALGERFGCAADSLGRPWCWGDNTQGQLGVEAQAMPDAPTVEAALEPTRVRWPSTEPVVALAAGRAHVLAIAANGSLWAWGARNRRQTGTRPGDCCNWKPSYAPERVSSGMVGWRQVAAGVLHSCGLREDGRLACWGDNTLGQVGTADPSPTAYAGDELRLIFGRPFLLPDFAMGPLRAVAAGAFHGCALDAAGGAWCWGSNRLGEVGIDRPDTKVAEPTRLNGLPPLRAVALGGSHACALDEDGRAWCWGNDGQGQLGLGAADEAVEHRAPVRLDVLPGLRALALGGSHTCGLDEDGRAWCWGAGSRGQLGEGARRDRSSPVKVRGPRSEWVRLAAGARHTCAIDVLGRLWCWGANGYGQLGVGDTEDRSEPGRVGGDLSCP